MRRGFLLLLLLLALAFAAAGCGGGGDSESAGDTVATTGSSPADTGCESVEAPDAKEDGGREAPTDALETGATYRLVVETNCGDFTITLDQAQSPKTAASLVALAEDGFYDGTTFHRVVPGFVIQGGDPTGTGTGGPGYQTVDTPPGDATYSTGVVAMAKAGNEPPGAAGSQFFVVTAPDAGLPPDYAIVGTVSDGMEAVSAIEALGTGDGPPSQPVVIEKVTVEKS